MSKCNTCRYSYQNGGDGWSVCDGCIHDLSVKDKYEPMTHFDYIHSMSDEKFAKWVTEFVELTLEANGLDDEYKLDKTFEANLLNMLKQPYKEVDNG